MTQETYTNVYLAGSRVYERGYDAEGRRFTRKVEFQPTLFIDGKKPGTVDEGWKLLDGKTVYPIQPGTIRDCKDFIEQYKDVSGFGVYGNTDWLVQYVSETYKNGCQLDMDRVRVFKFDIETATDDGFPDIDKANEELLLISILDSLHDRYHVFTSRDFEVRDIVINGKVEVPASKIVKHFHKDEYFMLKAFIEFWAQQTPDVITGWNIDTFDVPYMIRRCIRIVGEELTNMLSPWKHLKERRVNVKGKEEIMYEIAGVAILDYLQLYKKYTYTTQESYKLDHIAEVELEANKLDYSEYATFKGFYTGNWQKFVEYNVIDVQLVDRLEDKMRLIELALTIAYDAGVNFDDVFGQIRVWDAIAYSHLKSQKIVIPNKHYSGKSDQFEGAFVKEPLRGRHRWVASFDLNSLYPSLIMWANISPETMVDYRISGDVDRLLNKLVDLKFLKDNNWCMTANGVCYTREKQGFVPYLMEKMYADRSAAKKEMLKNQKLYEETKDPKYKKEASRLNNIQMAKKIALNSFYGAMGSPYFRYYDLRMAEGITTSGQLALRWMMAYLNAYLNKILSTKNVEYVITGDTDSIYLTLETLVEKSFAGKNATVAEKIAFMDKVCASIEKKIAEGYTELFEYMNAFKQSLVMKREVLADVAIFVRKKGYILNVHNSEGVQYAEPKMKITGLELIKSSTPQVVRDVLRESVKVMLHGTQQELQSFVTKYRSEFEKTDLSLLSLPRGVNNLKKYTGTHTIYASPCPMHVRAALLYNHHIKRLGVNERYEKISEGDKVRVVYLKKPNPFHENVIAFPEKLPPEFGLERFVDYDTMFMNAFQSPLETVLEAIDWKAVEEVSLEDFFS